MNDVVSKLRSPRFAALGLPALAITGAMLSLHADATGSDAPWCGCQRRDVHERRRADYAALVYSCHRPDSMAPMSFLTYEDVRPWARAIRQKVTTREMPPWYIDRTVGITSSRTIRRSPTRRSRRLCSGSTAAR